jgi:hypothetical protein
MPTDVHAGGLIHINGGRYYSDHSSERVLPQSGIVGASPTLSRLQIVPLSLTVAASFI